MRLRPDQIDQFAAAQGEARRAARAQAWAEDRPGAMVDTATGTVRVLDAEGREEIARFDAHGLVELRTFEGRTYTLAHDDEGRVVEAGLVGLPRYGIRYDDEGQPRELLRDQQALLALHPWEDEEEGLDGVEAEFADGTRERLAYRRDALVRTVDGAGGELRLERDSENAVRAVVDPRGQVTQYERDPLDPFGVTIVRADGSRETWVSEDDDLAVYVDDQLHGRVTGDERQERVEFADGHTLEIEWDDENRPLRGANGEIEVAFEYDGEGRVLAERQGAISIEYAYDEDGNLVSLRTSDGQENRFAWDGDGLLSRAEDGEGGTYELEYDAGGVVSRLRFPNGVETRGAVTPSPDGDLCTVLTTRAGRADPIVDERVTLDLRGRAVRQILPGHARGFEYDGAGRIVSCRDAVEGRDETFAWDASGNRIAAGDVGAAFDACNRIQHQGHEQFSHDAHGRMIGRTGLIAAGYTYDGQGNLTAVSHSGRDPVRFAYDAFGRRIRKQCGGRVTHFLWAGRQLLREWTTEDGRPVERRDYLQLPGERQPLGVRIDGRLHAYHLDRTGTPLALTDERGEVVWSADYDVFGRARNERGDVRQPLRHLGQYCDDETGLHYNVFRYYDPGLGRYLTPDPLRFRSGTHNFYTYANGDPVNLRDPDGHLVFCTALLIIAGAAVVGGLIGGAIGAATAEEGKGWEEFKKGFAWGALGGAVGAAVPIIGAAAGLGTAAIAGIALAADGIVAGVEACSEGGWSVGTFAKGAAISVAATVGTLGLAKIPGVKRALGAVGKRLKGTGDYLIGKTKQAYYQLFPGELAISREVRRQAEHVRKRMAALFKEGHGPQRHEGQVTEQQLTDRVQKKLDPETGIRHDKYRKNADGTPANHRCGDHATKINSPESYVAADDHLRNSADFKAKAAAGEDRIPAEAKLEDVYGPDYRDHVSGKSRKDPSQQWSPTSEPAPVDTDFTDGTVKAFYKKQPDGSYSMVTMFPEPAPTP